MAVDYKNTVCQVKAKVPAGQNPYRGFCDILQLKIPMYLCVTNALRTRSNEEEDQSWVIRENTWPTGAEEPSVVYNAIPKNTLEFCRKYYEKFNKYPSFDLFLYEASENHAFENSPDRGYLNANKFLSGELSTKYKVETHRIATFGSALQQFLSSEDDYKNFTFQYGLDTSYKLILRSSFISVGGTPATLWFKVGEDAPTQNLQNFTDTTTTLGYKIGDTYTKLFDVNFDGSEVGRVSSMKLTKITGGTYRDINVESFEFKYKTKDQSVIKSIVACDELLLSTEPTMRHQVSGDADLWYLDSVSKNIVDVNVSFSFDNNESTLSTEASVCAYQHYIYEMDEEEKNGDDENGNSILNLVGDYVKYTVPSSSLTNGDDADEDVRPITKPLFYLDEALNLPEFWSTTDETTL